VRGRERRQDWLALPSTRIELLQLARAENGLVDVPFLVGIHHEAVGRADFRAHHLRATMIVGRIAADFELELGPSCSQSFVTEARDFLVAEADPAD